jgi:hypothetical protein
MNFCPFLYLRASEIQMSEKQIFTLQQVASSIRKIAR